MSNRVLGCVAIKYSIVGTRHNVGSYELHMQVTRILCCIVYHVQTTLVLVAAMMRSVVSRRQKLSLMKISQK